MMIRFYLDGQLVEVDVKPTDTLLKVLVDKLGITSVHYGCGEGSCGACMVMVDGKLRYSCLTFAASVNDKKITTVAGLLSDHELSPLQKKFVENNAAQCGYCTPGMVLVAKALLDKKPLPSDEEIFDALAGNLCRCTGYVPIVKAVKSAARR